MKPLRFVLTAVIAMISTIVSAKEKTDSFRVYGNCDMCKKRIEQATLGDGVVKAIWDIDTKIMTVTYDDSKITNNAIQKKIATVGHDTEKFTAPDEVYEDLPECCLYERKKKSAPASQPHKH